MGELRGGDLTGSSRRSQYNDRLRIVWSWLPKTAARPLRPLESRRADPSELARVAVEVLIKGKHRRQGVLVECRRRRYIAGNRALGRQVVNDLGRNIDTQHEPIVFGLHAQKHQRVERPDATPFGYDNAATVECRC